MLLTKSKTLNQLPNSTQWSWACLGGSVATVACRHLPLPLPLPQLWPRRRMPHKAMLRLSDSIHSWRTLMPNSCRSLCSFVVSMAFHDTHSLDCFWFAFICSLLRSSFEMHFNLSLAHVYIELPFLITNDDSCDIKFLYLPHFITTEWEFSARRVICVYVYIFV